MTTFRLLIAEDIVETLEQLAELFLDQWPDAQVDAAASVEEARLFIEASERAMCTYDIAIVDFGLPTSTGVHPEIDDRVCDMVHQFDRSIPIAHITFFPEDRKIRAHMRRHERNDLVLARVPGFLISKRSSNWALDLFKRTRETIYTRHVKSSYEELFGPLTHRRRRGLTSRLHALCNDVSKSWAYLDSDLRGSLAKHLLIEESGDQPVRVTLR
jgi:hypothetical protein